jgi:hypothetical protein
MPVRVGSRPPQGGQWNTGDVIRNRRLGGEDKPCGWICREGGVPGIWEPITDDAILQEFVTVAEAEQFIQASQAMAQAGLLGEEASKDMADAATNQGSFDTSLPIPYDMIRRAPQNRLSASWFDRDPATPRPEPAPAPPESKVEIHEEVRRKIILDED